MAVRKRGVTFKICFRKRGSVRKGGGGVPTPEETMVQMMKKSNGRLWNIGQAI